MSGKTTSLIYMCFNLKIVSRLWMGTGASQFLFPKIFFAQPVNIWKESNVK